MNVILFSGFILFLLFWIIALYVSILRYSSDWLIAISIMTILFNMFAGKFVFFCSSIENIVPGTVIILALNVVSVLIFLHEKYDAKKKL